MKIDLDGLAANIKGELRGERADEYRFMVEELVRHAKRLERVLDELRPRLERLKEKWPWGTMPRRLAEDLLDALGPADGD